MNEQPRTLYVALLYNWETRNKVISLLDDSKELFEQPRKPGDHLYQAMFTLYPPLDAETTSMVVERIREEWETQKPKPEDVTTEACTARRVFALLSEVVPPFSFAPGNPMRASNYPGQNYVEFELNNEKYRLVVEKVGEKG